MAGSNLLLTVGSFICPIAEFTTSYRANTRHAWSVPRHRDLPRFRREAERPRQPGHPRRIAAERVPQIARANPGFGVTNRRAKRFGGG